ncbi:MAG: ATP-binding cassette domain-containing protein, partial [Verrucomicrobiota bacterium]
DVCSLNEVERKMIGTLSKGYRQRVGLADALVNKPALLILDEPTNGLDPNQIRQARELIRRLGERHTILISTHILSEVEMICGRVIIIDRGEIKASDTPRSLIRRLRKPGEILLEMQGEEGEAIRKLKALDGVEDVKRVDLQPPWLSLSIETDPHVDARESIADLLTRQKWKWRELASRAASLEDAFVDLVRKSDADTEETEASADEKERDGIAKKGTSKSKRKGEG